jgi:hypothetical protein
MNAYHLLLHGSVGAWDEIVMAVGAVISLILIIALALSDRKRGAKEKEEDEDK